MYRDVITKSLYQSPRDYYAPSPRYVRPNPPSDLISANNNPLLDRLISLSGPKYYTSSFNPMDLEAPRPVKSDVMMTYESMASAGIYPILGEASSASQLLTSRRASDIFRIFDRNRPQSILHTP